MAGFVKLDSDIVRSSLWIGRDLRSLFITALVMAEPLEVLESLPQLEVRSLEPTGFTVPPGWYGIVRAAGVGILRMDGIAAEAGYPLLEQLGSPDPDSRSRKWDGRRLARVDSGYIVLNYFDYRDRDYSAADRMRRLRERRKLAALAATAALEASVTANGDVVTANVTQAESRVQRAENRGKELRTTTHNAALEIFCNLLPLPAEEPVRRLIARAENPASMLAMMSGWLNGQGAPRGKPIPALELAAALVDLEAVNGKPTPAAVRSFLRRAKTDAAKDDAVGANGKAPTKLERLAILTRDNE